PSVQDVTISLGLTGLATQDIDYSASSTAIVIAAGQTSGSVTLIPIDDALLEGQESVVVDLLSVTNAIENGSQSATVNIRDDEAPNVSLSLSGNAFNENGGSTQVRVTLDRTASQAILVDLAFRGLGEIYVDYSASSASLAVQPGLLTAEITLLGIDDAIPEGTESIAVDIATVTLGQELGTQQVTASILDDIADSFELVGDTLTITGTAAVDTLLIDFGSSTNSFTATLNGVSATYSASTISFDGASGKDSLTVNLSPLSDTATLSGLSGSITSSNYSISFSNVETTALNGGASDEAIYNDPGVVNTAYLLPPYGILQSGGFTNQAIAFGNHTIHAVGNDDNLFIYGDSTAQAYVATPTQARMLVGAQLLIGNHFKRVYAYGMGGNDTATYSGTSADETMTALWNYTFVNTATTVQYFDSFKSLTVAGNGGLDIAVMYDSPGIDTFTSSVTSFRYFRTGVFNNIANGYDKVYAFNYFGGFDTATLTGSSGNDRLTAVANFSVIVTPTTLQQATGFRTVTINAGAGTDVATLQDSLGSDTLNTFGSTAELVYSNGRTVRAVGFDTVTANGTLGGRNRKNIAGGAFTLKLNGSWV
ncbi:MAG: hypothetical protein JNM18_09410, partial [Planctomycetaceae bacterium]|nr:hypothetical protein [Planctomycetaceae bacterium]